MTYLPVIALCLTCLATDLVLKMGWAKEPSIRETKI